MPCYNGEAFVASAVDSVLGQTFQDFELIVGIPFGWLERTAEGLAATHKAGIRYPVPFQIPSACDLPAAYITGEEDI